MKRVVVTGVGSVSSVAHNSRQFTQALQNMTSGIGELDLFNHEAYSIRIGAVVKDCPVPGFLRNLPRAVQFLYQSTKESLDQSSLLGSVDPTRVGFYVAGPACAVFETEEFYRQYLQKGLFNTDKKLLTHASWDGATNFVAKRFSLFGPRNTMLTACSSSGVAAAMAYDLIRFGDVDAMVVAGTDGFSEFTFSGFNSLQSISPFPCRPFDQTRQGLSFGEAAATFILEDYDHAKKRGAPILAELSGYGLVGEAHHLTAPRSDAYGFIRTMSQALAQGKMNVDDVTYVNAHGTATPLNDVIEGQAIRTVFKNRPVPVNSIKSLVGHCMGAAGAIEAVNCILSISESFIPGTKNYTTPDAEIAINVLAETRSEQVNSVLCNSAGFGGNNSSLLFTRLS